ncbi:MAG: hypothetical protein PHQ18_03235 [Patescibacteria group bacterium]|nr:hypothetical protein [Patescibacteria group bacterium]
MDMKKIVFTVVISVLVTSAILGTAFYFWQSEQNQKLLSLMEQKNLQVSEKQISKEEIGETKKEENILVTEVTNEPVVSLSETHVNRLFTIDYPSDWVKQLNESGGLMAILPPDDDHSVVTVRYVTSYDDIASCDLTTREWPDMKSTVVDTAEGSRLIKYEAVNRFQEKEIAFVAVSGEVGSVAHDCTIIDFEDVWTSHKTIASQIINSVKLRK